MDRIQSAVKILQSALQARPCCDKETQTDCKLSLAEYHISKGLSYFGSMAGPAPVIDSDGFDTVADDVSLLSDEDNLLENHMSPISGDPYSKKRPRPMIDTIEQRMKKRRKPRGRDSGANDDESFIMERHERTYLAYKPDKGSWQLKTVLREKGENWSDADNTISQKMTDAVRNGKTASNVFSEREKLVELWSSQNNYSYTDGIEKAKEKTNLELFVDIKKDSPGVIRSGYPTNP